MLAINYQPEVSYRLFLISRYIVFLPLKTKLKEDTKRFLRSFCLMQVMLSFLKAFETKLGIKITCSQETEPMGTAGPLALARDKLIDGSGEPFFVLNSDVISEYPLKQMVDFHTKHGGEASIMVTKVQFVVQPQTTSHLEPLSWILFAGHVFAKGKLQGNWYS